jgi:surface antigen
MLDMSIYRITSYLPLMLLLLMTWGNSLAQNTMFLRESPIAHLSEEDRQILRATIDEVLESPDGTVKDWSNPATGSHGRVKVLDTVEDAKLNTTCRNLRARNEARNRKADGIYRLCKAEDGSWKFASAGSYPPASNDTQSPAQNDTP